MAMKYSCQKASFEDAWIYPGQTGLSKYAAGRSSGVEENSSGAFFFCPELTLERRPSSLMIVFHSLARCLPSLDYLFFSLYHRPDSFCDLELAMA